MIGQSNYLENTIVKTPYEPDFDVTKVLLEIELPQTLVPPELHKTFQQEITVLWEKLSAEKEKWQKLYYAGNFAIRSSYTNTKIKSSLL